MACDCITKIDERLAKNNSRLKITFTIGHGHPCRVQIGTEKINTRNRDRMGALATFCPFCGTRYVEES